MKKYFPLLIIALLVGCSKKNYPPAESKTESVCYVDREVIRTVIDTVEVVIEVPDQSVSVTTRDTISRLETQFAESYAEWSNGMLTHRLTNKNAPIKQNVYVPRTESTKQTEKSDSVRIKEYVYLDKPPDRWTRFKSSAFWWLTTGILILLFVVFRKPIARLVKSLIL